MPKITWKDVSHDEAWEFKGYIPGREEPIVHLYKQKAEILLDVFVRFEFYCFNYGSYKPKSFEINEDLFIEVQEILDKHVLKLKKQYEMFNLGG